MKRSGKFQQFYVDANPSKRSHRFVNNFATHLYEITDKLIEKSDEKNTNDNNGSHLYQLHFILCNLYK